MTNWASSLQLVETEDICKDCGSHLYRPAFGKTDIRACLSCGRKRLDQKNKEIEYRGGDEIRKREAEEKKRDTYDWLANKSIVSDSTIQRASFDNYFIKEDETKINKDKAKHVLTNYKNGYIGNTFLQGNAGVGKSHLAMAILKELNSELKNKRCLFISIGKALQLVRYSYSDRDSNVTEENLIQRMIDADFLVIDDLGSETGAIDSQKQASDFVIRMLYAVMEGRQDKSTILTTNLSSQQLDQLYDKKTYDRLMRGAMKDKNHVLMFKKTEGKRKYL
ncbi:ATP-binding protein [Aerococcus kribbianus]|uniref:ATP-binding protein n=1 Tax=Aerococcus kribbianus TaxID=2999064 RepID=A0A9X3FNV1_9LACT|nr:MULTISPECIES: ATP-binding protein [unclassified Aerococcus]MCZ0717851.1 ATP-binding protein [Aerococcus sp. YH-aer221]MCZ0726138.1 ATP-binding protein [Aerococcus sp. YH-aer222]